MGMLDKIDGARVQPLRESQRKHEESNQMTAPLSAGLAIEFLHSDQGRCFTRTHKEC